MLPDRPGQLARISELLAEAHANVIEVLHTRHGAGLQISEVEIDISVETRGPEHRQHVVDTLRAGGYDPRTDYPNPNDNRPAASAAGRSS
jgi:threonine dehydratase